MGLGEANDVNELINFLISEKSKWITGQSIVIDGLCYKLNIFMLLKFNNSIISHVSCVIPNLNVNLMDYACEVGITSSEKRIIKPLALKK